VTWNPVKIAYLFCRYYPLTIAPLILWGLLGNHEEHVCLSYYRALYGCLMPTMLSAQFILMLRAYAFSGRKRVILVVLSTSFFSLVGYIIWVVCRELNLTALFLVNRRSGCFATTNQPTSGSPREVGAYQIGVISVLTAIFDCLNMFVVVYHCVRDRRNLGPLGQSFIRQGVIVYFIMTALNALTIGTYFTPHLVYQGQGSWFAYVLPSALSCRLVLSLRRKAAPTETDLHIQYSHMIDEALEMINVRHRPGNTVESSIRSLQDDPQAVPQHVWVAY